MPCVWQAQALVAYTRGAHLATREGQSQDFERNAVARCEAFTAMEERRSCVERTRQPTAGGSVSGGGVLREYTETVRP